MNRIPELLFSIAGLAGFLWFVRWPVEAHSSDFSTGLVVGIGLTTGLHLAYYLLCKYTGRRWDGMGELAGFNPAWKGISGMVPLDRCLETLRAVVRVRDLAGLDLAERAIEAYVASTGDVDGLKHGFNSIAQEGNEVSDLIGGRIDQLRRHGGTDSLT